MFRGGGVNPPGLPPPWLQPFLSAPLHPPNPLFQPQSLRDHLHSSAQSLHLLKSLHKELEAILALKDSSADAVSGIAEEIKSRGGGLDAQEVVSLDAAKRAYLTFKEQVEALRRVAGQTGVWEERSAAVELAQKVQKHRRNKTWKKKKRRRVAEAVRKEREMYGKADQMADEWRAREIAGDIAKRKMEKMKEIAKLKINEERKRLESEFELVLVVEKLQEIRAIRTQKLKKQGHFLPEEDNEFLNRVRAAVEEEERQAAVAADTDAARDAIASAEESRKIANATTNMEDVRNNDEADTSNKLIRDQNEETSQVNEHPEPEQQVKGQGRGGDYDFMSNLPLEFYHYYHGSNHDMGTLIEVRRAWDAYIRPGGSRIPSHWVQPLPPANDIWASYLVSPKH